MPEDDFDRRLASLAPNAVGRCVRTSPRTSAYNCFAWAVSDTELPWIPKGDPERSRWPAGSAGQLDLASVVAAFSLLGFSPCDVGDNSPGFERIALYVDDEGDAVHAARQLGDGRWTSKLGNWEDVEHDTVECLEGGLYGRVGACLRRPLAGGAPDGARGQQAAAARGERGEGAGASRVEGRPEGSPAALRRPQRGGLRHASPPTLTEPACAALPSDARNGSRPASRCERGRLRRGGWVHSSGGHGSATPDGSSTWVDQTTYFTGYRVDRGMRSCDDDRMLRRLQIFGKRRIESRDSRADAYPMPRVPVGWYGLLRSDELAIGELKSLHYFGKDLIAFRTSQGRATVLDAFCPHYGAHLGVGGRLVGDQIECPFHGWRFGSDGRCTHAPFVQQPPKASIGCHRVHEHSGVIFVHAGPGAPTREVPAIPEAVDKRFGPALYRDYRVRTHIQEMRENLVDEAHFQFIHGASRPVEQEFVPDGRFARVSMRFGKPLLWGRGLVDSEFRVEMYGPGVAVVRVATSIMDISAIALTTPVDEQLSEMRMIYLIKRPPFAPMLHPLLRAIFRITAYGEVDAEAAIWDRKIYQRRPILLPHEKGIRALRRWYEQFYEVDPTEASGEKSASPARHGAPDGSKAWNEAGE